MAIIKKHISSKLKTVYDAGNDAKGKKIVKTKSYPNVKETATDDNLYQIGTQLSQLQSYTLTNIKKTQEFNLLNE